MKKQVIQYREGCDDRDDRRADPDGCHRQHAVFHLTDKNIVHQIIKQRDELGADGRDSQQSQPFRYGLCSHFRVFHRHAPFPAVFNIRYPVKMQKLTC